MYQKLWTKTSGENIIVAKEFETLLDYALNMLDKLDAEVFV